LIVVPCEQRYGYVLFGATSGFDTGAAIAPALDMYRAEVHPLSDEQVKLLIQFYIEKNIIPTNFHNLNVDATAEVIKVATGAIVREVHFPTHSFILFSHIFCIRTKIDVMLTRASIRLSVSVATIMIWRIKLHGN
jgi:hypothetical protein